MQEIVSITKEPNRIVMSGYFFISVFLEKVFVCVDGKSFRMQINDFSEDGVLPDFRNS